MDYEDKLHLLLTKGREKIRTPSLAMGLSVDGDHYFASSGYANLKTRQEFSITSEFKIGKISEIFISILILQLIDLGMLDFNDPVYKQNKFLEFNEPHTRYIRSMRHITFKDLLTHTSGLGDMRNEGDIFLQNKGLYPERSIDEIPLKKYYSVPLKQQFAPQTQWYYSPHNYGLLALSLEQFYNNSIDNIFLEHIASPLYLNNTGFKPRPSLKRVVGYTTYKNKAQIDKTSNTTFLMNQVYSNIQDLLTLFDNLSRCYVGDSDELFNEASAFNFFKSWYQPHNTINSISLPLVQTSTSPNIFEYSSQNAGIQIQLFILPEYRTSLILVSNSINKPEFSAFSLKIFDILLKDLSISVTKPNYSELIPDITSLKSLNGVYRPDKPTILNSDFMDIFGNDLFINVNKKGTIAVKSSNASLRRSRNFKGCKSLDFEGNAAGSLIYSFKTQGRIYRVTFPKSVNPGYIYLQGEGPITLFRSKYNFSATRYTGLVIYSYFSKLRHTVFIPSFRKFGSFLSALPKYFLVFITASSSFIWLFLSVHLPKFLASSYRTSKNGYGKIKANIPIYLAKMKNAGLRLYNIPVRNLKPFYSKIKSSSFVNKTSNLVSTLGSKLKSTSILALHYTKEKIVVLGKIITSGLNYISERISNGFHYLSAFIGSGASEFRNIGSINLAKLGNLGNSTFPSNFSIMSNLVKKAQSNARTRRKRIKLYNTRYPRRFGFNKRGFTYLNYVSRPKIRGIKSKISIRLPRFTTNVTRTDTRLRNFLQRITKQ
ncbi:MAG: serine hydrolase domain-containing protein [Candidatus Kariarchaeaceae archaeon]